MCGTAAAWQVDCRLVDMPDVAEETEEKVWPPSVLRRIPPFGAGVDMPTNRICEFDGSKAKEVGAPVVDAVPTVLVFHDEPPLAVYQSVPLVPQLACVPTKTLLLLVGSTAIMTGLEGHDDDSGVQSTPQSVLTYTPALVAK